MMAEAVLEIDRNYSYESLDGVIDSASFADIGMGTNRQCLVEFEEQVLPQATGAAAFTSALAPCGVGLEILEQGS